MSAINFDDLKVHVGHNLECVVYRDKNGEEHNVAVECNDCEEVLLDFDINATSLIEESKTVDDCLDYYENVLRSLVEAIEENTLIDKGYSDTLDMKYIENELAEAKHLLEQ